MFGQVRGLVEPELRGAPRRSSGSWRPSLRLMRREFDSLRRTEMATQEWGLFLLWERGLEIAGVEVGSTTGCNKEGLGGYTEGHTERISFQEPWVRAYMAPNV